MGCDLKLYSDYNYGGESWTISQNAEYGPWNDNDNSAQLVGDCKNTSYLVFESGKETNDGDLAYLMGERDKVDGIWDKHQHQDGQRYWKRGRRASSILRIDIPTEDINAGRLRHDLDIHGKRLDGTDDPRLHLTSYNSKANPNSSDQSLSNLSDKGIPCPGR